MIISRTPYYIELLDAAGKKATGYIGAVGAGEALGGELLANSDFASAEPPGTMWTRGTGWTIFGGVGVATAVNSYIYQTNIPTPLNRLYKGQLDLVSEVAGSIVLQWSSGNIISPEIVPGTYSGYKTSQYASSIVQLYGDGLTGTIDNVSLKRVTDPPSTAVRIVSSLNGTTRDWASIEVGFDPNTIASWKIYALALPGFYLPSDGSTFNRGDFTAGNAFFWSSIDLSPYAGTLGDSIEQQIVTAIDTRFKTILVASGYATNIGQHVHWWKESPLAITDLPGMNLRDRDESRMLGCGIYDRTLSIEIEASVSGSDSPETARLIEADIEKAIFVDDTWDGLAEISDITGNRKEAEQKQNKVAKVRVMMQIEYRTIRGNAYTQP